MRLKICNPCDAAAATGSASSARHASIATGVVWTHPYETVSCGDDMTLRKWTSIQGQQAVTQGKLFDAGQNNYCTCLDWPKGGDRGKLSSNVGDGRGVGRGGGMHGGADGGSHVFAVGFSDGNVILVGKNGREEKKIQGCHRGGITSIKWSYEGTAFATTGEDGACKIFSRSGMLRTTLAQFAHPIYSCSWSADSEELILCCEKSLHFKSVQPGQRQQHWKAHDGIVLQADWCPVNNLILSCGEDCRYKVWDSYGRLLFASTPIEHVITSVSWAPDGKTFAVGSFNLLKLCDRSGWSYSFETPQCGSLFQISWCPDGTCLAAASGSGDVIFGSVVDRSVFYETLECTLTDSDGMNTLCVRENAADNSFIEELDFRDAIIDFSLHQKALVVVTNYQVFVYAMANGILNTTPQVEDLKEPPMLIVQSLDRFALVDSNGINVYSYEGRLLSCIKYSGMRVELLNAKTVSLAKDLLTVTDQSGNVTVNNSTGTNTGGPSAPGSGNVVRIFDVHSGKQLQQLEHKREILKASLNQSAGKVAILDKNKDLFLCPSHKIEYQKLGSMVEDFAWNEETDMLVVLSDQKLECYLYPNVVFVEATLMPLTVTSKPCLDAGPYAQLVSFTGAHVLCRKADGSNLAMMVSPFPLLLYRFFEKGQWDLAIRLCRYVKLEELWGCLACMAIFVRELNTVEIALAAIEEIDKVQFVAHINSLPDDLLKNAELSLFCKRPEEALGVLLANKRIFRAIKLCLRTHRWEQALDLAVQHQTHVDTVLAYRDRHLKLMRHQETNAKFKQWSAEVSFDWQTVQQKIALEKEREIQGAQPS